MWAGGCGRNGERGGVASGGGGAQGLLLGVVRARAERRAVLALRVQPTMRQGARAGKAGRGERPVCGASGFCSACWVWCARVQGVGPCSRFELRSTRYVQSQSVTGVQPGPIEHRRARSRHPARVCGQRMGTLWGSRALARTGESPPRSLVDGSCPALEAAHPAAPGKPCASLHVTCRCTGAGGASTAAADGGGRSLRRMMPPGASPLSFSGSMGRVAPSAKIVFLGRLCFSQNFTKTHFSREALAPSHSVSTTERG